MVQKLRYWQIASGSAGREYADEFIRYGMAFVGGEGQIVTMRRVAVNDRILLKRGMSELVAVGKVVEREGRHRGEGDKEWLRDFDGWDLPAYCYVDWHVPRKPVSTKGLTRATIQRVHKSRLKEQAEKVVSSVPPQQVLDPEPDPTNPVDDQQILEFLIRQGLRPESAQELTTTFSRIRLLARYYYHDCPAHWEDIREHETRTFLVIPLLLALGWAEQQIKIELPIKGRTRADVACFSKPYENSEKDECVLIIETKGFSQGLDYAPDQAKKYARQFPECQVVLVTNGYCYKAYRKQDDGLFGEGPSAYLNLLKPRDRYPLDPDNVEGSLEALRLLLPASSAIR